MPPRASAWNAEAVRDLLLAMAMSDGSKKPTPNWKTVESIMTEWGYEFTASAISQQFNKKIWRDAVATRGEPSPSKTATLSTPKKRGRKPKALETPADSDSNDADTPIKRRRVSAENGHKDNEELQVAVKKEFKQESI